MTQWDPAERMQVRERRVRTLLKRMRKQGDAVVVHGLRGRPSHRKLADKTQRQAAAILKQPDWSDFRVMRPNSSSGYGAILCRPTSPGAWTRLTFE
jgi:hypothetical protein